MINIDIRDPGTDILLRYIPRTTFYKRYKMDHPDPMFDELTYGEGGGRYASFFWKHVRPGSRIFFHTKIGNYRYLTAMYVIDDIVPGGLCRTDPETRSYYLNPHIQPEMYGGWWPDFEAGNEIDRQTAEDWNNGTVSMDDDVVVFGDPDKSVVIDDNPLLCNRSVLSRLEMQGKPVKWDIVDKHGRRFPEDDCMNSCLRVPRLLSDADGEYLEDTLRSHLEDTKKRSGGVHRIDSRASSKLLFECQTEKEIEATLANDLSQLDDSYELIGRQITLSDRARLDILADTPSGRAIVEVKKGIARDETLTQLLSYIVQHELDNPGVEVEGAIVCENASHRLRLACAKVNVRIFYYGDIGVSEEPSD